MKAKLSRNDEIHHVGIGRALRIELNEFKVNQAVIVRAPVMAVRTESGFSFEVVTDTGAEVNIIAESVAKDLGIRIDKTSSRANQVNKMPLNVTGMITIPVMHGK